MSRSYKKSPALSGMNFKGAKRIANKRVRRTLKNVDFLFNGKQYRKIYDSWEIRDYSEFAPSFEVFCERELAREVQSWKWRLSIPGPPTTVQELKRLYNKWYRRK